MKFCKERRSSANEEFNKMTHKVKTEALNEDEIEQKKREFRNLTENEDKSNF